MNPSADSNPAPPVNVLLVDDEPANLLALEAVLADLGQNLVKAPSGEEALRRILQDDFAVVLLDVQMRGLNGFETAQLIRGRARSRHTPIIFLTAHEDPGFTAAQAYSLGAVDYLVKPLVPVILRAKVAVFVELFQKARQVERQAEQLRRAQQDRAERRALAQYVAAGLLAEAATLAEAAPKLLRTACENLGWDVGALWTVDQPTQVLRCAEFWHHPAIDTLAFEEASRRQSFAPGVGIPGRVWARGEPVWLADLARDSNFPRAVSARQVGLRAACALPVRLGAEVLGVLEFFSREFRPLDDELLRAQSALASQVGQFLERQRAEQAARHAEQERAALLVREREARAQAEEAARRSAFLASASTALAASLDYEATLASVARLAVPDFADWCAVDLVAEDGTLHPVAVAHVDPARVQLAHDLRTRYPPNPNATHGVAQVLRTGRPELLPEISDSLLSESVPDPELLAILRGLGLKSTLIVPLMARGRTLGALTFVSAESGRRYGADELALAEDLARRAAVAVDNARLYRQAREEEERFRLVTDNVQDYAILLLDREGRVLTWNAGAERILGYRADEILGQAVTCLFTPEDVAAGRPAAEMVQAMTNGTAADECWLIRRDGSRFWASGVLTALQDGELRGFVKILRDLTERKALEDELRQRAEALAEANRHKDEFLSMLAHELRNPLAPLTTGLHVLERPGTDPAIREQALQMIGRQVRHLGRMIEDLLDVARIARGKVQLRTERLDLAQLVRTTAEDRRASLEKSGLTLQVEVPETPVWVTGDGTRLAQVLDNLLDNAARFTDKGGRVSVQLVVLEAELQAVVTVQDSGVGIEAAMLARLWDAFAQADRSLDRSRGGLGLGLTVVRGLVELHGGEVGARSEGPGRGAAFTVRLPAVPAPPALTATTIPPRGTGASLRVLIVEDQRDAADSLRLLLELLGHETQVAYTGPAGVAAAAAWRPDIVLCDIGLPGLDGYGVARELRLNPTTAHTRLLALTGYGSEEDRRRSREAGFDLHLTKPIAPETLQDVLAAQKA